VLFRSQAAIEAWMFPRVYQECGHVLTDDAVVVVKGRLDTREEPPKLVVIEVRPIDVSGDDRPLELRVPEHLTDAKVQELKACLLEHPGPREVRLRIGRHVIRLPSTFNVDDRNGLMGEVRRILGPDVLAPAAAPASPRTGTGE
jgi:DNA polymerase-3 subunit alpha